MRNPFTLVTMLVFLIPLYLSWKWGVYIQTLVVGAVFLSSVPYHLSLSKKFVREDKLSAWALVLVNIILIVLGGFTPIYTFLVVVFSTGAIWYYEKPDTDFNHGMWHIFAALVTTFSLMAYNF